MKALLSWLEREEVFIFGGLALYRTGEGRGGTEEIIRDNHFIEIFTGRAWSWSCHTEMADRYPLSSGKSLRKKKQSIERPQVIMVMCNVK